MKLRIYRSEYKKSFKRIGRLKRHPRRFLPVCEDDVGVHGADVEMVDDGVLEAGGRVAEVGELLLDVVTNLDKRDMRSCLIKNEFGALGKIVSF